MLTIRQEKTEDYSVVFQIIAKAFEHEVMSDHQEQFLVERLRSSEAFIPELSLVAELNGQIVGHILLTKIIIKNDLEEFESLALAPVSVLPAYQGQGIGGELIKQAHSKAKNLGHQSIILLGHADYYPRFGYQKTIDYGITLPFEAPPENCMAMELIPHSLDEVSGMVVYPKAFFD